MALGWMPPLRRRIAVACALALVVTWAAAGAIAVSALPGQPLLEAASVAAIGTTWTAAAFVAVERRPGNATGWLMLLVGAGNSAGQAAKRPSSRCNCRSATPARGSP